MTGWTKAMALLRVKDAFLATDDPNRVRSRRFDEAWLFLGYKKTLENSMMEECVRHGAIAHGAPYIGPEAHFAGGQS